MCVADLDVDALTATRLAGLPRQVVLRVLTDRQPAEHDVAELAAAQLADRRHHPAHAEQRAELLGVARAMTRPGADHFLQRDDVGSIARMTSAVRAGLVRPSSPRQRWML